MGGKTEFCLERLEKTLKILKAVVEGSREEQHKRCMLRQNLPGSEVQYYQQSYFLTSILFRDVVYLLCIFTLIRHKDGKNMTVML